MKLLKLEKLMESNTSSQDEFDESISFEHDAGELDDLDQLPTVS